MKKLLTIACLFVVATIAIVSFIAPAVFGQEQKKAKASPATVRDDTGQTMCRNLDTEDVGSIARHPEVSAAIKVLDAWVEATVADREQPGLSIGIVYDQELIWAKGYGFADVDSQVRATPATVYRIGSISKVFTATAILQLRDGGKLQLDDPVAKYLPWFKVKNRDPEGPVITIRHLLTHTSGLPWDAPGVDWDNFTGPSRQELIRGIAEQETLFPAETHLRYSNLGYVLLGEIVAAVSGEPFSQYVKTHILNPLGMTATDLEPTPDMPGLAVGYGPRVPGKPRKAQPFADTRFYTPAGDGASSVEDFAKFASLQLCDRFLGAPEILKPSTLREMRRVHWLAPDWRRGRGLGFSIRRVGEQLRFGHGGDSRGFLAEFEIAPVEKLAVIVFTNASDGSPRRYLEQALAIVGPAVTRATAPARTTPTPDPTWGKYVGTYKSTDGTVKIMVLNGELTSINPSNDNPWESRGLLKPVGPHTFRRIESGGIYGELLRFEVDHEGRVTALRTSTNHYSRE